MANILNIKTEKIPYTTKFKADNGIFTLSIKYNPSNKKIYFDLLDEDGNCIAENRKAILNVPLFWENQEDIKGNLNPLYPDKYIVPITLDGTYKEITLNSIGVDVFFILATRGEKSVDVDYLLYK